MDKEEVIASIAVVAIIATLIWMFSQIDGFVGKRRLARREKEKKEKKSKLIKLANKKNPDREKKIRISKKPPTSDNVIKWVRKDILEKAIQEKKAEKKQEADNRKKLKSILESDTLLADLIREIWQNRKLLGGVRTSLVGKATFFCVRGFVIEAGQKKIRLSIDSFCGDHSLIGRVIVSAEPVAAIISLDNLEKLAPENIKLVGELLTEIYKERNVSNG